MGRILRVKTDDFSRIVLKLRRGRQPRGGVPLEVLHSTWILVNFVAGVAENNSSEVTKTLERKTGNPYFK